MKNNCPFDGDIHNDCEGCSYSADYHFYNGECIKRNNKEDKWITCPNCGHKLFKLEEGGAVLEIKCSSCKEIFSMVI